MSVGNVTAAVFAALALPLAAPAAAHAAPGPVIADSDGSESVTITGSDLANAGTVNFSGTLETFTTASEANSGM